MALSLKNILGEMQFVREQKISNLGIHAFELNLNELSKGIYFAEISLNENRTVKKFVRE